MVAAIVLLMSGFKGLFVPPPTEIIQEQPVYPGFRIAYALIYSYPAIYFLQRLGSLWRLLLEQKLLVLFVVWCGVSIAWSAIPGISFRKFAALSGLALFAAYFSTRFDYRQQLLLIHRACLLCLAFVVLTILALPQLAWYNDGRFIALKGIFDHKNILGCFASIGILSYMGFRRCSGLPIFSPWGVSLVGSYLTLIIFAHAITALLVLILLASALLLAALAKWFGPTHRTRAIALIIFCAVALLVGAMASDAVLENVGREKGLTGRTALWSACIDMGLRHPLIGYGFNGFWNGFGEPSRTIWLAFPWHPNHAHNGPLDWFLQLGAIGTVVALVWMWVILSRCRRLLTTSPLHVCLMVQWMFIAFTSLTESLVTAANTLMFLLLVQLSVMSSRLLRNQALAPGIAGNSADRTI